MTKTTKIIWMYWAQGWDRAPELVRKCRYSWEILNPEYQLVALDDLLLSKYFSIPTEISVDRPDIAVQQRSDLIRIGLLEKHGGVWADATLMCSKPLIDWLPEYYSTEFFAFRNPGRDRMFSSWFMASEPNNKLAVKLYIEYSTFLSTNSFTNQNNIRGKILRSIYRNRWNRTANSTINWHSEFARRKLKTYPYFIFHYTFNKIILENEDCRQIWENSKPYEARLPHEIQKLSRQRYNTCKAEEFIISDQAPVHKLNRRRSAETRYWKAVLNAFETARKTP